MIAEDMGATFFFLEAPGASSVVVDWFDDLALRAEQITAERGQLLLFADVGAVYFEVGGRVDAGHSPLVSLVLPRMTLGSLATMGEVHFLTTTGVIPRMDALAKSFGRWLNKPDTATRLSSATDPRAYYLEGSIRNIAATIYAFPSGLSEIEAGRYFLTDEDASRDQSALCKRLRLRGLECG